MYEEGRLFTVIREYITDNSNGCRKLDKNLRSLEERTLLSTTYKRLFAKGCSVGEERVIMTR